jgi:hypothetical protein
MPSLLRLASEPAPDRAAIEAMGRTVEEALASAEAAGYRIDALLGTSPVAVDESEIEPEPTESEETVDLELDADQIESDVEEIKLESKLEAASAEPDSTEPETPPAQKDDGKTD